MASGNDDAHQAAVLTPAASTNFAFVVVLFESFD
jgi:hypothetical protein